MEENQIECVLEGLLERLAAIEHDRWSHWQRYVHAKGQRQADGSIRLPPDLVQHWEKQLATAYEQLTEEEKDSDREQVRRYLPVIAQALK
jgi:hypothetical protein